MIKNLASILCLIVIISCGGNEGTIRSYSFCYTNLKDINTSISLIFENNREYITDKYGLDSESKYCKIYYKSDTYYFKFRLYDSLKYYQCLDNISDSKCVMLALKTGGKEGEGLPFEKDIAKKDKKLYEKLFKDSFINKLRYYLTSEAIMCEGE